MYYIILFVLQGVWARHLRPFRGAEPQTAGLRDWHQARVRLHPEQLARDATAAGTQLSSSHANEPIDVIMQVDIIMQTR